MKVYVEGTDENKNEEDGLLPELEEGETLKRKSVQPKQHFTQPPPRYTEARLVRTLEELGIGRPSTYAPTLETIQKRGYVTMEDSRFVPTELGETRHPADGGIFPGDFGCGVYRQHGGRIWTISRKGPWIGSKCVDEFYRPFHRRLTVAEKEMEEVEIKDEVSDEVCEKCGRPMVYKMGRFGKFLACSGFPECRNAKPILKSTGVACPSAAKGEIVERKSKKRRTFYGCSRYPECDFVSWDKPVPRPCPKCGKLMVEKKKKQEPVIRCTECGYEEAKP